MHWVANYRHMIPWSSNYNQHVAARILASITSPNVVTVPASSLVYSSSQFHAVLVTPFFFFIGIGGSGFRQFPGRRCDNLGNFSRFPGNEVSGTTEIGASVRCSSSTRIRHCHTQHRRTHLTGHTVLEKR